EAASPPSAAARKSSNECQVAWLVAIGLVFDFINSVRRSEPAVYNRCLWHKFKRPFGRRPPGGRGNMGAAVFGQSPLEPPFLLACYEDTGARQSSVTSRALLQRNANETSSS